MDFFIDFFLYSTVYCVQEERHREQKEQEQQKQSRLQPKQKLQEEVQKEEVLEEEDEKAQAQRERAEQTELFRELGAAQTRTWGAGRQTPDGTQVENVNVIYLLLMLDIDNMSLSNTYKCLKSIRTNLQIDYYYFIFLLVFKYFKNLTRIIILLVK